MKGEVMGTDAGLTAEHPVKAKPKRRWLQFSLRTLLVLMLVCGCALGWLRHEVQRARAQREAAKPLEELGGDVVYNRVGGPVAYWLGQLLGEDLDFEPTMVSLDGTPVTDAGLTHLKGLPQLRTLILSHSKITDAGLKHLRGLTRLERLYLRDPQFTDAGLENLQGLTQLTVLDLSSTPVTDAGLMHLKGLPQLRTLILSHSKITDAGLVHLKGLPQLQTLILNHSEVTDAGLEHLQGLTQLTVLGLSSTQITDAGLEHLQGLKQLRWLYLGRTQVTDAGVYELKMALKDARMPRDVGDDDYVTATDLLPQDKKAKGR
jgi:Leucine-rich repeat (LRR) protein